MRVVCTTKNARRGIRTHAARRDHKPALAVRSPVWLGREAQMSLEKHCTLMQETPVCHVTNRHKRVPKRTYSKSRPAFTYFSLWLR